MQKMEKLLLKLISQERISLKEGDEINEQFLKNINNLGAVEEEKFLNFNRFTDRWNIFYTELSITVLQSIQLFGKCLW